MKKIFSYYKNISSPVKASVWFVIANVFQKGISILTLPLFTRLLTTEEFGQFNVYQSWLGIITIFTSLNLSWGVYNNGLLKYYDDRNRLTSTFLGLSTTSTVFCFIIYIISKNFWDELIGLPSIVIFMIFLQVLVSPALDFWTSGERFDYKYKKVILVTITMSIINPIVGFFAVTYFNDKGIARIISNIIVTATFCIFYYFYIFRKSKVFFNKEYWVYGLKFNIPLIPHYLSTTILSSSDRIMINNMVGTSEAGIYSVAYSAGMILTLFSVSINNSFIPWTYKKMKLKKFSEIGTVSNFILLLVAVLVIMLMLLAPEIITLLASEQYNDAIIIIPQIALSVYFMFLHSIFANIEFYYEKSKFVSIASIGASLVNIALNYLLIPIMGYKVAGFTTLMCYIILSISHYYFMKLLCKNNNQEATIYDSKFILILSSILIVSSIVISRLYEFMFLRWGIIIIAIIYGILNRNKIYLKLKVLRG